jgi:SiaC family regulatory phosphoprotein
MEQLLVKGTEKTPSINFNSETGKLHIGGRSYSSDAFEFYKPVNDWLNRYIENPKEHTVLEVNVDYFHSVSIKYLTTIIKKIAQLHEAGHSVKVIWLHQADENDEDESFDLGKSIESESRIEFDFVQINS